MLRLKISLMESIVKFVNFITYFLPADSVLPVSSEANRLPFIPGFT